MNYLKCLSFAVVLILFSVTLAEAKGILESDEAERSYYVSAGGNDANNGLSELSAFRTLAKAVELACENEIKRITVIGVLDDKSENSAAKANIWNMDSVFYIIDSGDAMITIAGKPGTGAALRGGNNKRVITICGNVNIRFENILITGGSTEDEGGGIYAIDGAEITLAKGAVIRGNLSSEGGGIYIEDGSLTLLDDAAIIDNEVSTDEGGGAVVIESIFIMTDNSRISGNSGGGLILFGCEGLMKDNALIADNQCEYFGGGVWIYESVLSMQGNSQISGNRAGRDGGGIWVREGTLMISERALISGNEAGEDGGGIGLENSLLVLKGNAEVSGNLSGSDGGGIHSLMGSVILDEYAVLADNESSCGGGLCIENDASAVIRGSVRISGNSALGHQGGGGICAGFDSIINMSGGEIVNNVSTRGGGAYFERSQFNFDGGSIVGNKAELGGGIYAMDGSFIKIGGEASIEDNSPNNVEEY